MFPKLVDIVLFIVNLKLFGGKDNYEINMMVYFKPGE